MSTVDNIVDVYQSALKGADMFLGGGTLIDRVPPTLKISDRQFANIQEIVDEFVALEKWASTISVVSHLEIDVLNAIRSYRHLFEAMVDPTGAVYLDSLKRIYDITISKRTPQQLYALRHRLETALQAGGFDYQWPDNMTAWRSNNLVTGDEYVRLLELATQFALKITFSGIFRHIINAAEIKDISNQLAIRFACVATSDNWQAYSTYEGNYRGVIEVNSQGGPFYRGSAAFFSMHEAFPGHFAESIIREYLFSKGVLHKFYALQSMNFVRSLITEGLADYSVELFLPFLSLNDNIGFLEEKLFTDMRHNIAMDYLAGEVEFGAAVALLMRSTFCSEERAERALKFAEKWKFYFPTYSCGYEYFGHWVKHQAGDVWQRAYIAPKFP
jgi:hypothetical protein